MKPRDAASLSDILCATERATRFLGDLDAVGLAADDRTEAAIARQLEIIGEATRRLSKELTDVHPEIPWARIAGTRHRVAHEYDEVDLEIVVRIVREHLPLLRTQVESILGPPDGASEPPAGS